MIERMWRKGNSSCTIDGDVNWYGDYGEQCDGSLTDWKQNYHMIQQSHSWVWKWKSLSCVQLFAPPWAIQSVEFSQARILECIAFPFSKGSSQPRIKPRSPALQADSLPAEPQGKPKNVGVGSLSLPSADLPEPGIEPGSPAVQEDSLPTELGGKPYTWRNP